MLMVLGGWLVDLCNMFVELENVCIKCNETERFTFLITSAQISSQV
jgi:hypothetical protein